jgi:cytochrome oxidase Cu insertion factor (SCO1/SenC/PrrC family)
MPRCLTLATLRVMATRSTLRRRLFIASGPVVAVGVILAVSLGLYVDRSTAPATSASNPVQPMTLPVPARIASIPLLNQSGKETDLEALHGRIVVLADFMTSCQEECPITTGALLSVNQALASAHLLDKVTIVELTVDPWRDVPSRLLAYSRTFGIPWTLLTGSRANLEELWSWFGVFYQRVKEGSPPDTNWQTGMPYTFDIDHSDNVFVLGASGGEQALVQGNADVGGKLPKALAKLLSAEGQKDLTDPGLGSWTPAEMLQAIGSVLGRTISPSGS